MAFRIQTSVSRGEIDCREKGQITGRIWLKDQPDPLQLSLRGFPCADLAGVLLHFHNPEPVDPSPEGLHPIQQGSAGDITASRKSKIPDCTAAELSAHIRAGTTFSWHWGNTLYVEWYSEKNGRVVIESSNYILEIEGPASWKLTAEDEKNRMEGSEESMASFLEELGAALTDTHLPEGEDENLHEEEREADQWDRRMNQLNDRIEARLNGMDEIPDPDTYDRIYQEEREKLRIEWGEPEPEPMTPEEEEEHARWIDEMNAIADQAMADHDENEPAEHREHPLVSRCHELGHKIFADIKDGGWLPENAPQEHPLHELEWGVQFAGAKLAGALNSHDDEEVWPPNEYRVGDVLVRLKKSRELLRDALAGLDAADEENLGSAPWRAVVRVEINEILAEVLRLLNEARDSLG